jgi:uncharacterized membrane protein YqjE
MKFYAMVFAAVGEFAITIVVFYFVGQKLDESYGNKGFSTGLTVVGLVLGFARAAWTSYKLLKDESSK